LEQWPKRAHERGQRIGRDLHRQGDVLKRRGEHAITQARRGSEANGVHQAVQAPETALHLERGGLDLSGVGDVELDDFSYVA